jgi:gamma-glutamyl phosphate reductase
MISEAQSVEEARTVFDTLQKTMQSAKKASPQSLSEAVTRRSSVILSGNRKDESTTEKAPAYNRWATLAGLEEK